MKTTYANSDKPKLMTILATVCFVLCMAAYFFYFAKNDVAPWLSYCFLFCYILMLAGGCLFYAKNIKCTIDDEEGTFVCAENKKHPMKIENIDTITFCQTKKGRLKYLNIHEKGVQFVDIALRRRPAERMTEHLLRLNPDITIKTSNFV